MAIRFGNGGELHLDEAEIGRILKSPAVAALVNDAAQRVAGNVAGKAGVEGVWVEPYTTDRAAAAVTVAVKGGTGAETKYGLLSNAAIAAGLEYNGRGA